MQLLLVNSLYYCEYNSPIGKIGITADNSGITELKFDYYPPLSICINSHIENCIYFLDNYFAAKSGDISSIKISDNIIGTDFEKRIWNQILHLPCGKIKTYFDIASELNISGGCQAVGKALGKNPILIIIPCHRIIGKSGKLTGFAAGLERKRELILLEKRIIGDPESLF